MGLPHLRDLQSILTIHFKRIKEEIIMFSKIFTGAVLTAGAIVLATAITEFKKNEAIKSAGKDFAEGAKNLGKEIGKSVVNTVGGVKAQFNHNPDTEQENTHCDTDCSCSNCGGCNNCGACDEILSSENGDIAVCAEGIKETDEIQQDKFADADMELADDEIIDYTKTENTNKGTYDDTTDVTNGTEENKLTADKDTI